MSTHQVTPQSLVEQGLHASVSDDCMVVVRDSTGANLRWANNTLTTNGVMHGMDVSVVSFVRGTGGVQVGTVSGSAASQAQVTDLVRAADPGRLGQGGVLAGAAVVAGRLDVAQTQPGRGAEVGGRHLVADEAVEHPVGGR